MKFENYMTLEFPSRSSNEAFARSAVACFAAQLDPTLEELGDIKTAVSEAVTNCIVHAYPDGFGTIVLRCRILKDPVLAIVEKDTGRAVRCNIEGYPYVLIWSKPEKPYRFVCIEPWHSLPGEENGPLPWEDRPCAAALHPGETWSTT